MLHWVVYEIDEGAGVANPEFNKSRNNQGAAVVGGASRGARTAAANIRGETPAKFSMDGTMQMRLSVGWNDGNSNASLPCERTKVSR